MQRDGARESLWQHGVNDFQPTNSWDKNKEYDVVIVGAGITGLTTALVLQQEGLKCIVAEAHTVGFGTSGGTTAHLNTLLDSTYAEVEKNFSEEEAKTLASGLREAIDLIEGLINKYSIDCDFMYKAAYLYAENDKESKELEKIKKASEKAGIVLDWSDTIPVPIPFDSALRVEMQAQLHAGKYLMGLAKAFEQEGGVILQHCKVNDITGTDGLTADTTLGDIKAKKAVYATHIPPGVNIFSLRCAPYRSYAMAFTLNSGNYPDGMAYDMKDIYYYFRTHEVDGVKYVIGGGCDHKTGHNDNTEYVFTELESYMRRYFDIEKIAYKWSSQYYIPTDGLPYIGTMPGTEHICVATGFGGNGMVLGSLAAKIICAIKENKETPLIELFDPSRIKLIAGFSAFVKENTDVVSTFIGQKLSFEKVKALVELAPGQAIVAEYDDRKVALYKDDSGHVYALDPVCPHAKCTVNWNSAEKTWDCPCHGGRYAANGDLLTGPATKGLTQIKWEDIEGD